MARARNIKPSFFTNEVLGTEDPLVGLTFIGLWCLADKDGILEDRPLRIKAELFPYREKLDVNRYLTVLERTHHILRYVVDGNCYIKVINFEKHQHPHHTEKPKGFPQPQGFACEQPLAPLSNGYTPSDSLIPDSLIPDSLIPELVAKATSENSSEFPPRNGVPYEKIVQAYHETLPMLPQVIKLTAKRKSHIKARWQDDLPDLDHWKEYFGIVKESPFLLGKVINGERKPFLANLDWLINESNAVKVFEGRYLQKGNNHGA